MIITEAKHTLGTALRALQKLTQLILIPTFWTGLIIYLPCFIDEKTGMKGC